MLFEHDRHELLDPRPWSPSLVHDAIVGIVEGIERSCSAQFSWPVHPLDDEGDVPATGFKGIYLGSAGVLWTLSYLQREGAAKLGKVDPIEGLRQTDVTYRDDPDTGQRVPSYFLGHAGILLLLWQATGCSRVADDLYDAVASNVDNPTREPLWGAPGTMLAAWHMWTATGEPRWSALFVKNVDALWNTWRYEASVDCHLWTQDMYGREVQYLGAAHGFAGNVHALLKGVEALGESRRGALYERCVKTLRATAVVAGDEANWPAGMFAPRSGGPSLLMQWCHGAPGIVTALSGFPSQTAPAMDALLTAAGRAIWSAGPLAKGYGLCHGTAGNGYAFLKLWQRTGEATWLERARSFAMHAIGQRDRARQAYGQGRYSLFTGDAGLAVYLWHCLGGTATMPALDVL